MRLYLLPILFLVTGFTAGAQNWQIADKYSIKFSSNEASGIFKTIKGSIQFDDAKIATAKFDVTIDVASINTGNGLQNKHAKEAEWFDAAKYPTVKFVSKKVTKSGAGYQVTGDLEIKGVKKEITFPFTFDKKGSTATFAAKFSVKRSDYNVGKSGGDVDDVIKLDISIPVKK